jgi:hypothetical protein
MPDGKDRPIMKSRVKRIISRQTFLGKHKGTDGRKVVMGQTLRSSFWEARRFLLSDQRMFM